MLKWNPEYYTIWNQRRTIFRHLLNKQIQSSTSDAESTKESGETAAKNLISADLEFLIPLLRKFPKCYWVWNYRLWLLQIANEVLSPDSALGFWRQELYLASKMHAQDSRNFHAWGYRRTATAAIEAISASTDAGTVHTAAAVAVTKDTSGEKPTRLSLLEQELEYTTKMVNVNLSNFSAWHHRSKILPRLLDEKHADDQTRRQTLDTELDLVERALYTGDNDQSLWFYHQNLMCTFDPRHGAESMTPNLSREERMQYVHAEFEKVQEMLDGAEDCKWIYLALIQLSLLHQELAGTWPVEVKQVTDWIGQLQTLDPLRSGRWKDLNTSVLARL